MSENQPIVETFVIRRAHRDLPDTYEVHVRGPDPLPGHPAPSYADSLHLTQADAERLAGRLIGRNLDPGHHRTVTDLRPGDRVVARFS